MNKDEALKLALEALHGFIPYLPLEHDEPQCDSYDQAITAIKAALEAKDEPVAWRDAAIRLGEELSSVGPDGYYDMDAKKWLDWAMEQNPRGEHSLPQRTWVGLTNEDLEFLFPHGKSVWLQETVKIIEAKLKAKNS
jgi:hypothetical protein